MAATDRPTGAGASASDTAELLSGTPASAFAALLGRARTVDAGRWLFEESTIRDQALVLVHGWACAYRTLSDGRQHVIEIHLPGEVVGLAEVWTGSRGTGVRALTETRVAPVPRARIVAHAHGSSAFADHLLTILADTTTALSLKSTILARHTAYERVAGLLWSLRARSQPSQRVGAQETFYCPVSQSVIADALGLSIVHVNRSLGQLARDGVLHKTTKHVKVLDAAQWRRIVTL